jgi:hypothetical protein
MDSFEPVNNLSPVETPYLTFIKKHILVFSILLLSIFLLTITIIYIILPKFKKSPIPSETPPVPAAEPPAELNIPLLSKKEVFHVGDNVFTYDESKAVCKSLDSKLATYDQVVDAYKNGADWCSYGWSEDQMALFPTQKKTWDELQKAPNDRKSDCGSIGINGGYFEDKNLKLGANCYGAKRPKDEGSENTHDDYLSQKKKYDDELLNYFKKSNADYTVIPHNRQKWSEK